MKTAKTISIIELLKEFSTEHKSIKLLEKIRWGKEPICPHCGGIENINKYKSKKHTYWHKDCRKAFTVKTNTIMHSSKIPNDQDVWKKKKKHNKSFHPTANAAAEFKHYA